MSGQGVGKRNYNNFRADEAPRNWTQVVPKELNLQRCVYRYFHYLCDDSAIQNEHFRSVTGLGHQNISYDTE